MEFDCDVVAVVMIMAFVAARGVWATRLATKGGGGDAPEVRWLKRDFGYRVGHAQSSVAHEDVALIDGLLGHAEPVHVVVTVSGIARQIKSFAKETGIQFQVRRECPETVESCAVICDRRLAPPRHREVDALVLSRRKQAKLLGEFLEVAQDL